MKHDPPCKGGSRPTNGTTHALRSAFEFSGITAPDDPRLRAYVVDVHRVLYSEPEVMDA